MIKRRLCCSSLIRIIVITAFLQALPAFLLSPPPTTRWQPFDCIIRSSTDPTISLSSATSSFHNTRIASIAPLIFNVSTAITNGTRYSSWNELKRFYRQHGNIAPRSPRPEDQTWMMTTTTATTTSKTMSVVKNDTALPRQEQPAAVHKPVLLLLATLRLSPSKQCAADGDLLFMRGLCVHKDYQRQGLALALMQHVFSKQQNYNQTIYCFASNNLTDLYNQAGFEKIAVSSSSSSSSKGCLPSHVHSQFDIVNKKQSNLALFVRQQLQHSNTPIKFLLLQHANELHRTRTATGQLLLKGLPKKLVQVERLVWSGRIDNDKIHDKLHQIQQRDGGCSPLLLWIGGQPYQPYEPSSSIQQQQQQQRQQQPTLVLLDGTWQEAKTMYRKITSLHQLHRVSIHSKQKSSIYTLRRNYGYQTKFGNNINNNNNDDEQPQQQQQPETLLCTVEVVAAVLDQQHHPETRAIGDEIRQRLQRFQMG